MSSEQHDPNRPSSASPTSAPGLLRIELPHWTAKIRIYDNLYKAVPSDSLVPLGPEPSGIYTVTAELPPGIYQVEIALEGKTQSELAIVRQNQTTPIDQQQWKDLQFESTAPLADTNAPRKTHIDHAEEWSRKLTWTAAPGGNSRLFLFVRTQDPKRYPAFAEGLALFDAQGAQVTDFATGVKKNAQAGWMAFNADLPAGHYILRRGRRGVRVRQQPLYLCAGWETHVFLVAYKNYPSLRTLTLYMARLGAGFQADDEIAVAAEVVLDNLRRNRNEVGPVARSKIAVLLEDKLDNPWLGILAAYALLRNLTEDNTRMRALFEKTLAYLAEINDHPDVRALRLQDNEPATMPFWHPPLLRDGLQRVQQHATRFAATIPLESLTDVVLDNLVVNSPWTAWRHLDRQPYYTPGDDRLGASAPARSRPPGPAVARDVAYTQAFLETASPKAPIYRISPTPEAKEVQARASAPATVATVEDAALLQRVQELTQSGDLAALPEKVNLDRTRTLNELLAQVTPEAVSTAKGLPLARTERGLESLRQSSAVSSSATTSVAAGKSLTPNEQVVFEYALQQSNQTRPETKQGLEGSLAVPSSDVPSSDVQSEAPSVPLTEDESSTTLEECVAQLRIEADRLRRKDEKGESNPPAQTLAMRLQKMAEDLLAHADFIVITNESGRISYGNGAFLLLLLMANVATNNSTDDPKNQGSQVRQTNQRLCEAALVHAPPGYSTLSSPLLNKTGGEWELRRTIIEDETTQKEHAYLNVLRDKARPTLPPATLQAIQSLLPDLTFYASLYAYGSPERKSEYLQNLEELTTKLEQTVQ